MMSDRHLVSSPHAHSKRATSSIHTLMVFYGQSRPILVLEIYQNPASVPSRVEQLKDVNFPVGSNSF